MALHHQLPVYKQASELTSLAADLAKNMPRDFKRPLGERILSECFDVVTLIFRANVAVGPRKVPHIEQLHERIGVVELMLRLAVEKRLISHGQYARAIKITDSIGKQATGWKKHAATSPAA